MDKKRIWGKCIYRILLPAICVLALSVGGQAAAPASAPQISAVQEEEAPFVMIRVEGLVEKTDKEALLERLNEIRREACEEGVRNPADGIPMTPEDYVPLRWSDQLEEIAVIRAAESTILQDHVRPDGSDCFTAAPEGVAYTMETLAWGYGSAAAAVEGWYSEKASYVKETGEPAGHYIALINPENRFAGIADVQAKWQRDACAGAFAGSGQEGSAGKKAPAKGQAQSETGEPVRETLPEEQVWNIPLKKDYLESVIGRAVEITALRIINAAVF